MNRSLLLGTTIATTLVVAGCAPEAGTSLEQTTEVQSDLTAIFTRELGAGPDEVISTRNEERCDGVRGSALELRSMWHGEQDPARLEAAEAAGHAYLDDRGTAQERQLDPDGIPIVANGDLGLPATHAYEAWAGGLPGGAMVRTFSACLDPATLPSLE